jgi:hypothetical protein
LNRAEYQRLRRQLDEELRAGIEMLRAGHRAKVEALEDLWDEPSVEVSNHPVDRVWATLPLRRPVDEILDEMRGARPRKS